MQRIRSLIGAVAVLALLVLPVCAVSAQGVTTGSMSGIVSSNGAPAGGARVVAVHVESGTRYSAIAREDGRYLIASLRVGGPYTVTASRIGLQQRERTAIYVTLGQSTQLNFDLNTVAVQLGTVTVQGERDAIMSPDHTGAATTVNRETIASMPTISGRLDAVVRLTPQAGGTNNPYSFVGQDPRYNNITVDGSYFNNSFGLGNTPGDRTGVAPISLNAVEQVQVSVSPFDVRQGNFVGANVNTVTRSGTNTYKGSLLYQTRNQNYIGKKAGALAFDPGTTSYQNLGGWISGPIIKDKLFFFANYENDAIKEPATAFRARTGSEVEGGVITRVKASTLDSLSDFLSSKFGYTTGPYQGYNNEVPATRALAKLDYNVNDRNKLSLRYVQLDSKTDVLLSTSSSLGFGRSRGTTALNFKNTNYNILENIKSFVGELNTTFGNNMSNQVIAGYTKNDESRGDVGVLFPFVDILEAGSVITSFGAEPFTPNNELRYTTAQVQNTLSIFRDKHTWTFGVSAEKYNSENVFFPGTQSAYVYNSLADFYTDANGYLANPNRTVSPVTLRRFQVRYVNLPGITKPVQPLEAYYAGVYAQDEWTPTQNLTLDIGMRIDVPKFKNTAYDNANVDKLTFRDENGASVQYNTGKLPDPKLLFSPRVGFNWDVTGDRSTQLRGGVGIFTGKPAYVWISNQIGNTGVLTGFDQFDNTTARPWNPNPDTYKPKTTPTGTPAASVDLNVTDPNFTFPQLWRFDGAVDKKLPWGLIGTAELIYNHDLNGVYYINANLPAAQSQFVGADTRKRWTGTSCNSPTAGPCVTRLNNASGNVVTNAIVLKNQSVGYAWNQSFSLERSFSNGFYAKAAYSYGEAKNTVDPGSTASSSWGGNATPSDPNNPGVGYSAYSPGHRFFFAPSLRRNWFKVGSTSISAFSEWRTTGNFSYIFNGDANGDGQTANDLLYIPKDASEMAFNQYTQGSGATAVTFTAQQQADAWEKYIQQDDYLKANRGKYAQRNAVFQPKLFRTDLSAAQEITREVGGKTNGLEVRIDVLNFGNLLNKNWGLSQRFVSNSPLTTPVADASGKLTYRLRNVNNVLMDHTYEPSALLGDVYRFQLSLRYNFY